MKNISSQDTVRQRFDKMKPVVKDTLDKELLDLIKKSTIPESATFKDYIPVDVDVSPFDNTHK